MNKAESIPDILSRRKEIEQEIEGLLRQTGSNFNLRDIKEAIYNETEQNDLAKMLRMFDTGQEGIELNNIMETLMDAWNYFPHKSLGGISPAEKSLESPKGSRPTTGFVPFEIRFPKLAEKYLINFTIPPGHATLPGGVYTVKPSFCLEIYDGCDCRKSILNVYDKKSEHLASVHYGWEDPSYYVRKFPDVPGVDEMSGLYLEPMCYQSKLAPAILDELKNGFNNLQWDKIIELQYKVWYQCLTGENVAEVKDNETAYALLDQQLYGIPYNAIKFLRQQPTTTQLFDQIIFSSIHAYDDTYYDEQFDWNHATPLWYAIVAENHLTEKLIDPVLALFAEDSNETWDFLDEQGEKLLGLLVDKFPGKTIAKTKTFLDKLLKKNIKSPYLHTAAVFEHKAARAEIPWLLKFISHPNNQWQGYYAYLLAKQGITEAIPTLKAMHAKIKNDLERREIETAIEDLEYLKTTGKKRSDEDILEYNEDYNWETHFKKFEDRFYPDEEDNEDDAGEIFDEEFEERTGKYLYAKPGTPRNAPCPCGSGKKYRKCHGK
ncbi:MAG: SEC-C domain-containing protein [Patescibacteria group bacterium]|nr:SEC-C domain-containing protein [Patescibacteria group bacterium]